VSVLSETCLLQASNACSFMLILTHVVTKLCWSISSLFEEIQVELDTNVDDHDMQLQL
jgi:hypothetical protein